MCFHAEPRAGILEQDSRSMIILTGFLTLFIHVVNSS